jgi:histidine triad (HIT) family protein
MLWLIPLRRQDQDAVRRLILAGLVEHWGFLDSSKNPDLDDLETSYAGQVFLTAWQDGRLAGSGALVFKGEGQGEIVRMSVDRELRRRGIGGALLNGLLGRAQAAGLRRVTLETTASWQDAVNFYLHSGFELTHRQDGNAYFARLLPPPADPACIFCRILGGQAGEPVAAQTGGTALISSLTPLHPGHVLVIPLAHIPNLYALPAGLAAPLLETAQGVAQALKRGIAAGGFGAQGVSLRQHNDPAGDQDVFHLHIHVIPRYAGDRERLNSHRPTISPAEMEANAARLRAALLAEG